MSTEFTDDYLMEHCTEGARIRNKTDKAAARSQLFTSGLEPGMFALDVGCASGAVTVEMGRIVAPATAVGADSSDERIAEARALARESGVDNVEFRKANVYSLPFEDNTFDFVWTRFLLEYLPDPVAAIREMKRVTKPGGLVVCADLDGNCLFHYPIDPQLESGIQKVMRMLASTGFDPWVGRKLYHFCRTVGFSEIEAHMVPHHLIAGIPCAREQNNWHQKIDTLRENLLPVYPDRSELDRLAEDFKRMIDSPDTFTYSPLIMIVARK
ncbi:MAG: methyltransferase domain-containing protein [Desulfomonile tiedjei]|nr:methyltransferase domain-containing protein [Desulfomonile tiedjei]